MKEEPNYPPIDPELEARIVALVLGEASDFERDDLNRLIQERPELSAFMEEIQSVHGLLRDVGAGDSIAADDDWKLSAEKRSAVLAVISGESKQQPAVQLANKSAGERGWKQRSFLGNIAKIAAVLLVAGFIGSVWVSHWMNDRTQVATSETRSSFDASESFIGEAPGARVLTSDGAMAMTVDEERFQAAEPKVIAESDYKNSSKSALSAIRESLGADATRPSPYYLMDDVQYFPAGPEFKLPREAAALRQARAAEKQMRAPTSGVNGPGPGRSQPTAADLALIPQNVESSGAAASKDAVNWRDSFGVNRGLHGESNTGGDTEDESKRVAGLGMGDRPVAEGKSESSPELAMPALLSQEPRQSQSNRKFDVVIDGVPARTGRIAFGTAVNGDAGVTEANPSAEKSSQGLSGGTNLRYSIDLPAGNSPAAGKEMDIDGVARYSEEQEREFLGVEGSRAEGIAAAGTPKNDVSELLPEDIVRRDLGVWSSDGKSTETPPSKRPVVAGMSGRKSEDEKPHDYDLFMDSGVPVPSAPSPTSKPMSSSKDLKKKEVTDQFQEEFAKGRLAMPSNEGLELRESRVLAEGESNGRQIPVPVTGTAIGLPRGELQVGQANQGQGWSYEAQPKTPQGGPAGLKERRYDALTDNYRTGFETYWEGTASQQKRERAELSRLHDQLSSKEQNRGYRYVPPKFMFDDNDESKTRASARKSVAPAGLNERIAGDEAFSTFSLHVSDVSFKLARAALANGQWPEAAKVRIEEFVNAFDYGDPMPSQSERVACRVEQSIHPFLQQRNLLRVSMRTAAAGRASNTPLRLTFLLDNSGSMERTDRQQTVRRAFALLAQQLKPIDQVTLISFARQPRLLADKVSGAESDQLVGLIQNLPSEGGTNIEAALQLGFEKAQEQWVDNAQNRIILLTDGAVNLGDANPESLARTIVTMRGAGIAFDAAGISAEGLNDEILEALTRKGDGRYYLLDSLEAADDGFARQIAGALRPSAKNVKVQIEFNPKRVGRYKLLGFEKHRLKQEDFRNDKVDAAEMAAAEAGVAVYQFEAKADGEGDVGSVSVRFRDVSTQQMIENCWPIPYDPDAPRADQAAPSLRIAATAALLAAKLRGDALGETVDLKTLSNLIAGLPDRNRDDTRVGQLQLMIGQARQVSGK